VLLHDLERYRAGEDRKDDGCACKIAGRAGYDPRDHQNGDQRIGEPMANARDNSPSRGFGDDIAPVSVEPERRLGRAQTRRRRAELC